MFIVFLASYGWPVPAYNSVNSIGRASIIYDNFFCPSGLVPAPQPGRVVKRLETLVALANQEHILI
jgi:hypothetical protein